MKPRLRIPSLLLLCSVLLLRAAPAGAREVRVTVLHTTDLHGHLFPVTDYEGRTNVGGILRMATLLGELREKNPGALLVDCGDMFQGSPESFLTRGRSTIKAIDWLRYDAWALGNHEFDWGLPPLQALHDATRIPMIAANIVPREGRASPLPKVKPFVIREVDGVKVAIVGLITPGVPSWSTPDLLGDCVFEDSITALERVMPQVRAEDPDIVLLATHQGFRPFGDDHANQVNAIAGRFPEFDAIIGGHSHVVVQSAIVSRDVMFTQAGYHGIWVGQLDLYYDTVRRRVVRREGRVHEVADRYPPHPELEALLAEDLARATSYLADVVGEAADEHGFEPDVDGRSAVQTLLSRAIAKASGVDLVLHGSLDQEPLRPGPVTMRDVWRLVPFENRIAVFSVTPGELIEILNENYRRNPSIHTMGPYGFSVEREDGRVVRVRLADGSLPHSRQRMTLAVNSYVAASGGRRFPKLREILLQPEARFRMVDVQTREALVDYIRQQSPLRAWRADEKGAR